MLKKLYVLCAIIVSIGCFVYFYNDYQEEQSYNAWFYEHYEKIHDKDYHIDTYLVPLKDDIYLGTITIGDDRYYVVNEKIGSNISQRLIKTSNSFLHIGETPFLGHEYIPYPQNHYTTSTRVITVPNEETIHYELKEKP